MADIDMDPLQAAIVGIVAEHGGVRFSRLPEYLADAGFSVGSGDAGIVLPGNIVVWEGMSPDLSDAIQGLVRAERLYLLPSRELWYVLLDGCILDLPIARRPPRNGYRRPHWLPCVLRLVPQG